jgi:hypothetical protein
MFLMLSYDVVLPICDITFLPLSRRTQVQLIVILYPLPVEVHSIQLIVILYSRPVEVHSIQLIVILYFRPVEVYSIQLIVILYSLPCHSTLKSKYNYILYL